MCSLTKKQPIILTFVDTQFEDFKEHLSVYKTERIIWHMKKPRFANKNPSRCQGTNYQWIRMDYQEYLSCMDIHRYFKYTLSMEEGSNGATSANNGLSHDTPSQVPALFDSMLCCWSCFSTIVCQIVSTTNLSPLQLMKYFLSESNGCFYIQHEISGDWQLF